MKDNSSRSRLRDCMNEPVALVPDACPARISQFIDDAGVPPWQMLRHRHLHTRGNGQSQSSPPDPVIQIQIRYRRPGNAKDFGEGLKDKEVGISDIGKALCWICKLDKCLIAEEDSVVCFTDMRVSPAFLSISSVPVGLLGLQINWTSAVS